ncbi:MAG: Toxin HigB-1 [Chlamydiae bacterium]|nr:Toxin HigB-1 [Chlamydiota bacterium]
MIDAARKIEDLKIPPGNRLELLKGKFKGKHSIRINDQWRIIFFWLEDKASDVEIIDYHRG